MDDKVKRYARYLLIMAGLGGLIYGIDVGVIAAALPYIRNTSNYSAGQLGFIVGAVLWGSVLSSLFAGSLSEWLGRKAIIIASAFCFFISIPVICLSGLFDGGNFALLTVGRTLQGASAGLVGVVVPMYLAECLDSNSRGKGTGMFQLLLVIGLAFAAVIGLVVTGWVGDSDKILKPFIDEAAAKAVAAGTIADPSKFEVTLEMIKGWVSVEQFGGWTTAWQTIFLCSSVPGLILFLGAFRLKESPRWLYKKGRTEEALASLAANNGEEKAKEILAEMIATLSKPTVSLVLGGGHSIGVPLATAGTYSFIAESATMTLHPIRMSGLVIGAEQTYEYFRRMQDRIVDFIVRTSHADRNTILKLMSSTSEMANDVGTILYGKEAVEIGLIDQVGGLNEALQKLRTLIDGEQNETK